MITVLFSSIFTLITIPFYIHLLLRLKRVQLNYKKASIPYSFGLFIILVEGLIALLLNQKEFFYFEVLFLISIIGTYDDFFGEKEIKGFKGHFSKLVRGRITTGFIKAYIGSLAAMYLVIQYRTEMLLYFSDFFLIILMSNTLNLLDLRPGRSFKVYYFFFLLLGIQSPFILDLELLQISLGVLIIVFFYDLRAKIMLGDSGSNILGFQLGIWYSLYYPLTGKLIIIMLLSGIQVYSERKSISQLIERYKLLRIIDEIGRKGMG